MMSKLGANIFLFGFEKFNFQEILSEAQRNTLQNALVIVVT